MKRRKFITNSAKTLVGVAFIQFPINRIFATTTSDDRIFDVYMNQRESLPHTSTNTSKKKTYIDSIFVEKKVYEGNNEGVINLVCAEKDTIEAPAKKIYQTALSHQVLKMSTTGSNFLKLTISSLVDATIQPGYVLKNELLTFTRVKQLVFLLDHKECNVVTGLNPIKMYGSFFLTKMYNADTGEEITIQRKSNTSGGEVAPCFLTSACVRAKQLPDNCDELTVLRNFRDEYMMQTSYGEELVKNYYSIAPSIVAAINASPANAKVYEFMYENLVQKSIQLIHNGQYEMAMEYYRLFTEELAVRLRVEGSFVKK